MFNPFRFNAKRWIASGLLILALVIGGFIPLSGRGVSVEAAPISVGLVVDVGGISDNGFNQSAYQGLLQAATDLGITYVVYTSVNTADYATNLQICAEAGNNLCFAVGFSMADAVNTAAAAKPGTHFAIVDVSPASPPANLRGITFNEKQVGYLAGALAGKMSASHTIGVVGGMMVPPVVNFAEGYRNGARCADWRVNTLITYTGTFTNPSLGATTAQDMIGQGADVIFGAAGATGNGAILYSAQHNVWSIGVDMDQYVTVFGNGSVDGHDKLLTSAMKRVDRAIYQTIQDEVGGTFTSGTVLYGLDNDGVALAPFHDTDASISTTVKDYLASVEQGIINGNIDVNILCPATARIHLPLIVRP